MANIIDYLHWRGDLRFTESPFNSVDNLILSRLSYLPFEHIVPAPDSKESISLADAASQFFALSHNRKTVQYESVLDKNDPVFLAVLAQSKRFAHLRLSHFVNNVDIEKEKQFAALTISGEKFPSYISFRGTDLTIVGWKEDFNMSFLSAVPSQLEAVVYLENAAKFTNTSLRVGGHSKGGNLAVYASAFCDKRIQKKITAIYNNDGPGFSNEIISRQSFQNIADKIQTFIPQTSVIGMLFEHEEKYTVVESAQKGLMQHDLFSWQVTHNDFVRLDDVSCNSKFLDKTMKDWLGSLSPAQREELVNHLYHIFISTNAETMQELSSQWLKSAASMIKTMNDADETTKKNLGKIFSILVKAAKNNINYILPNSLVQIQKHSLFQFPQMKIETDNEESSR